MFLRALEMLAIEAREFSNRQYALWQISQRPAFLLKRPLAGKIASARLTTRAKSVATLKVANFQLLAVDCQKLKIQFKVNMQQIFMFVDTKRSKSAQMLKRARIKLN